MLQNVSANIFNQFVESKRMATSHQYGNALLGVCYQEEEEKDAEPMLKVRR